MKQFMYSTLFALATAATAQTPVNPQVAPPAGAPQAVQPGANVAQTQPMTAVPSGSVTVTEWYKQNVYDPQDNKTGEIMDVLMDKDGKAIALVIGVGGFLGAGEKDVAVPFHAVEFKAKDNKPYLVMSATKDSLKSAKGFKYDRNAMTWIAE